MRLINNNEFNIIKKILDCVKLPVKKLYTSDWEIGRRRNIDSYNLIISNNLLGNLINEINR